MTAQPHVSFFPDDLPDPPLTLEDFCPGYFLIAGEVCLLGPDELLSFYSWTPYELGDSTPAPLATQPAPTPVDVSASPLSAFTSRFQKLPASTYPLAAWLGAIRDGEMSKSIAAIRDSRGTPRYYNLKKKLPCIAFAGTFPAGRAGRSPTDASGLVFLEVDFHDGAPPPGWLESEKTRLSANPAVVTVYVSAGGAGLHAVAAVDPIPVDRPSYRQAWAWATRELALEDRGDPAVKDSTRLALISHDPTLYSNLTPPTPALGTELIGQPQQEGTERH